VLQALGGFQSAMRLKKAVGKVMANRMSDQDMEHLGQLFKKFDENGDGRLSLVGFPSSSFYYSVFPLITLCSLCCRTKSPR